MSEGRGGQGKTGGLCPSCERYIGPEGVCPFCDADVPLPAPVRALRYGAWVLALGGLAALYLAATRQAVQGVRIGDISPMMNFASVRVEGAVPYDAFVGNRGGRVDYVSFTIDDGSGRLRVAVYGEEARALVSSGRVPRRGARAEATGSLNVKAGDQPRLRLASARQLKLKAAPADTPAGDGQKE